MQFISRYVFWNSHNTLRL